MHEASIYVTDMDVIQISEASDVWLRLQICGEASDMCHEASDMCHEASDM